MEPTKQTIYLHISLFALEEHIKLCLATKLLPEFKKKLFHSNLKPNNPYP